MADTLESRVKAAFLYNFAKFSEWPAKSPRAAGNGFNVCVMGENPFGTDLDTILRGRTVAGEPFISKRIFNVADAIDCRILFVSSSESERLDKLLRLLAHTAILTVGDLPNFTEKGGIIRLFTAEGRVRFEINLNALERAGLNLSSQVLVLGRTVRY